MSRDGALRVATYNVHGCVGRDGRCDPGRVAEVIRRIDADVIGLQEVDERCPLTLTRGLRPVEVLARGGGYRAVFGATMRAPDGEYGNVLLTRHPAVEIRHVDLSVPGAEPRAVLDVVVKAAMGPVRVLLTHFGLRLRERHRQTELLLSLLDERAPVPLVLLGDFNEWVPRASTVRRIEARMGMTPRPRSFPARWPLLPLDRIWVRPREALRGLEVFADGLSSVASDHLPVYADLDLRGPAEGL